MMAVCKKCHEIDKVVIKCYMQTFEDHAVEPTDGECELCGKKTKVVRCYRYGEYIKSGGAG